MRKASPFLLLILLSAAALIATSLGWSGASAQSRKSSVNLNEPERALLSASRNAVLRTGMSPNYFDRHFTLVKVVNQPGDRRVVWKFSVNEYDTTVTDVLGYYTKDGKRFDTHSVATTLRATSEIKKTISRKKANEIMRQCIGRFVNPSVEYRSSPSGPATIVLTAEALPKEGPREPENQPVEPPQVQTDGDEIKKKRKKGPPTIVGAIDLQSGKCTRGELQ